VPGCLRCASGCPLRRVGGIDELDPPGVRPAFEIAHGEALARTLADLREQRQRVVMRDDHQSATGAHGIQGAEHRAVPDRVRDGADIQFGQFGQVDNAAGTGGVSGCGFDGLLGEGRFGAARDAIEQRVDRVQVGLRGRHCGRRRSRHPGRRSQLILRGILVPAVHARAAGGIQERDEQVRLRDRLHGVLDAGVHVQHAALAECDPFVVGDHDRFTLQGLQQDRRGCGVGRERLAGIHRDSYEPCARGVQHRA